MICDYCPRGCKIDRKSGLGYCKSPWGYKLARASLHHWEEPCISGTNGSATVFFSGCNLSCKYCQNYEISHGCKGIEVTEDRLIEIFERLIEDGAHNINLVTPSHYAYQLANTLSKWKSPVPVVYNTSGYDKPEVIRMLDGLVDIYLADLKYIRSDKAQRYSNAGDYFEVADKTLHIMREHVTDTFDGGLMKSGMIIRHLILPENTNSSLAILDYIKDNFSDTAVSLMAQYVPCGQLESVPELNRKITRREYDKVVDYALSLGLENVFIQELDSSDKRFIPAFDYTGIL